MKIDFLLDNEGVSGIHVFEGIKAAVPKQWFKSSVQVGDDQFDLRDHANNAVIEMMFAVTKARGTKAQMSIEIPDHLVQDGISEVRKKLLDAIIQNALKETDVWEDESSSFTDGEQAQAPTGSLG